MRVITVTGEFTGSIPVNPRTPGKFQGTGRADFMKAIYSLAAPDAYGWDVRVAGQHWDGNPATAGILRVASSKLGKSYSPWPRSERQIRHVWMMADSKRSR